MAKTKNIVKASATIISITELGEGDVYQRLEGNSDLRFGIVVQVLNNGEDAVIQALEIDRRYGVITPEIKTFGTDSDLKIFPADPAAVQLHLNDVGRAVDQLLVNARKTLDDAEKKHEDVTAILKKYSKSELKKALTVELPSVIVQEVNQ